MIDRLLQSHLAPIALGSQRWKLWRALAGCWGVVALAGLVAILSHRFTGLYATGLVLLLGCAGLIGCGIIFRRFRLTPPDYQAVARQIEAQNPELHALLLTAVEQVPLSPAGELNYLQQRVVSEALRHYQRSSWGKAMRLQLFAARSAHWAALAALVLIMVELHPTFSLSRVGDLWAEATRSNGVTVTPGDTSIERGSGLVVLARFEGSLPAEAELVIKPVNEKERRISLAKNLADPVFGGGIPDVKGDLTYHVEYSSGQTRDFKVSVFDYPKLERADAKVTFPAYTQLPEKIIPDTRRVSAVEGSSLDYTFMLNKPVTTAQLVARDKSVVPLTVSPGSVNVYQTHIALDQSKRYELILVDDAGRTNKVPPEFVLEALKNRPPELKLASPRGDQRVSALQEIAFDGETSGDFGLHSYGIAYSLAGGETKSVELGQATKPRDKKQFNFLLPLESLGAQPDELLSYYLWAEDAGPDGQTRRTASDMYFAEIKPFEEIFREGQQQDQNQNQNQNGGQQGGQGNQTEKLADLEKQIISATWNLQRRETGAKPSEKYKDDVGVVHDSQAQAIEQVQSMSQQVSDPKMQPFVETAQKEMEKASTLLGEAAEGNSVKQLTQAVTDEQSAYQALLKLAAREYQVTRGQRGQRGGGGGSQRAQRQLDQLDLKQTANRYETQREATPAQNPEQREQLQVANRLKELAQRQQDLNSRIKELQAALQEAATPQEREQLQDRLKRLRDEQQDLLADVDELRQRMDRPENQSRMADERQQLEQTRSEVQQAAQSLQQQAVPQALASGTRAQRDLQQLQDDVRKKTSGQFGEDIRRARDDARQLAQKQDDIDKKLNEMADPQEKTLTETDEQRKQRAELAQQLEQQKTGVTNLLTEMRQISEQSETAEPLLSEQLYDTLRKTGQDDLDKALDSSSELVQRGFAPQAAQFEQPAKQGIEDLKNGVEHAAESILGDGTEALRLAKKELEDLNRQLTEGTNSANFDTNALAGSTGTDEETIRRLIQRRLQREAGGQAGEGQDQSQTNDTQLANAGGSRNGQQQRDQQGRGANGSRAGEQQQQGQAQQGSGEQQGQSGQRGQNGGQNGGQRGQGDVASGNDQQNGGGERAGGEADSGNRAGGRRDGALAGGPRNAGGPNGGSYGGAYGGAYDWAGGYYWDTLIGGGYVDWTDRLRSVEEMIDVQDLSTQVAQIRDRARTLRLDYKKTGKKPDWAVVRTQIAEPLAEVRSRVAEELMRRESKDALVPLDRDPVPAKFSELVRRYYEQLGSDH